MDPGVTPSSGTTKVPCGFFQALCDPCIENIEQDDQAGDPCSPQREVVAWPAEQREVGSEQPEG